MPDRQLTESTDICPLSSWPGATTLQHQFGKCVPKALRSYLQVPSLMSHHYFLGGKSNKTRRQKPHGLRCKARIALRPRPPTGPHRLRNAAAAGCAPGRCAPHRVGAIHYATRSALQLRTQRPLHAARYSRGRSARWRTQGAAAAPAIATRFMCSGN